jgi:2-polyprenyl-6-methoxyphenol hydroxylase-like FAD-dependent oxidoreductase
MNATHGSGAAAGATAPYDALVIGARVAGAATALLLARQGRRVLVVDRARYGADTLSTHALMRGGVVQLQRWGVLPAIRAAGTPAIRTTTFHYGADVLPIRIKPRDGVDALYAPRRTLLDAALVDAAREAGAEFEFGEWLLDLVRDAAGRVRGAILGGAGRPRREVAADLVIGADGLRSTMAGLVRAPVELWGRHAAGVIYGYWPDLELDGYHWYYREGVSAGAIPTNDGRSCVFVSMPSERFRREAPGRLAAFHRSVLREAAPDLAAVIDGPAARGAPVALRAFPGEPGRLRHPAGPGWALVGDAGFFRDPITAHGLTDALRDAELLAQAIGAAGARGGGALDHALGAYPAARDDLARDLLLVSDRIAAFAWNLDEVRELHLDLSRLMGRESEQLAAQESLVA